MNCQLSWEQRSQYQFHASTSAQRATELCGDLPGAAPLAVSCSAVHHRIRIGMSEVIPHDVGTGLQRTLEHEWPWDGFEPTVKRFDHLQVNWGEHIGKPTRFTHGWKLPPSIDAPKTKFANMHEYALLHAKTFTFFHLDTIDPNKNMRLGGSWSYAPRTGAWLSLPKRHGSPSGAFFMKCQGPHRSFRSSCWNIWGNCSILPLIWRKCWMVEGRSKNRSVWQNFAVFCCAVCMRSTEVEKTHFTLDPPNILIQTRKNLKKPFARMVKLRFFASWSCTHSLKMHGNDAISICKPIGSDLEEKHTNYFGPFETWWMSFSWTCQRTLRLYILCLDLSFDQRQVQFFFDQDDTDTTMWVFPLMGVPRFT